MLRFSDSKNFEILGVSDLKTVGISGFNGLRIKVFKIQRFKVFEGYNSQAIAQPFSIYYQMIALRFYFCEIFRFGDFRNLRF